MGENAENTVGGLLRRLLSSQASILSQMDYLYENLLYPISLRTDPPPNDLSLLTPSLPHHSPSSLRQKKQSPVAPTLISYGHYWNLFANFSALYQSHRRVHSCLESLVKMLESRDTGAGPSNTLGRGTRSSREPSDIGLLSTPLWMRSRENGRAEGENEKGEGGSGDEARPVRPMNTASPIPGGSAQSHHNADEAKLPKSKRKERFTSFFTPSRTKSMSGPALAESVVETNALPASETEVPAALDVGHLRFSRTSSISPPTSTHTTQSSFSPHPQRGTLLRSSADVGNLVTDFFTCGLMKQFLLEHLMYVHHFTTHIVRYVVKMRRLWLLVSRCQPAYDLPASRSGARRGTRGRAPETTAMDFGYLRKHLSKEDYAFWDEHQHLFLFLVQVLGTGGRPADPRVTRAGFLGCGAATKEKSAPPGDQSFVAFTIRGELHQSSEQPVSWAGFDVLLALLTTPVPAVTRFFFYARLLLESGAMNALNPGAALRLQKKFVEVCHQRIQETYSVVVNSVAERDVSILESLMDPEKGSVSGKKSSSGTAQRVCGLRGLSVSPRAILASLNLEHLTESLGSSPLGATASRQGDFTLSSFALLPWFTMWVQLKTSPSRSLFLSAQLQLILFPSVASSTGSPGVSFSVKRIKVLPRLIFLFSDSIVCCEEQPNNGRLSFEFFLPLKGSEVFSSSTAVNAYIRSLEGERGTARSRASQKEEWDKLFRQCPYTFVVHHAMIGEVWLSTETSGERYYWMRLVKHAIQAQPRFQQQRELAQATGEPPGKMCLASPGPLPRSSRLGRQRVLDAQLQLQLSPVRVPVDTPAATPPSHIKPSRLAHAPSELGDSPPSRQLHRELSHINWSVIRSPYDTLRRSPSGPVGTAESLSTPIEDSGAVGKHSLGLAPFDKLPSSHTSPPHSITETAVPQSHTFRTGGLDAQWTEPSSPAYPDGGGGPLLAQSIEEYGGGELSQHGEEEEEEDGWTSTSLTGVSWVAGEELRDRPPLTAFHSASFEFQAR